jgi:hypothetical protein
MQSRPRLLITKNAHMIVMPISRKEFVCCEDLGLNEEACKEFVFSFRMSFPHWLCSEGTKRPFKLCKISWSRGVGTILSPNPPNIAWLNIKLNILKKVLDREEFSQLLCVSILHSPVVQLRLVNCSATDLFFCQAKGYRLRAKSIGAFLES